MLTILNTLSSRLIRLATGVSSGGDLLDGWDFRTWGSVNTDTSDWVDHLGLSIVDHTATPIIFAHSTTQNSFQTSGVGGVYFWSGLTQASKTYRLTISGTTTASGITILDGLTGSVIGTGFGTYQYVPTAFDNTSLYIRNDSAGKTVVTTLTLVEIPDLTEGYDFTLWDTFLTEDWLDQAGGTIVDQSATVLEFFKETDLLRTATTFTTTENGGVYKDAITEVGESYDLIIAGTTSASGITIYDGSTSTIIGTGFGTFTFTATNSFHDSIFISNDDAGTTEITTLILRENL